LSLSGYTADKNYDIWIYNNAGTLTLASTVWTDDTTRATALTTQDGIYVKSGATNYRYIGTIRITSTTGQCEDSVTKRFVWNCYNQVERYLLQTTSVASYSTSSTTWHPLLNDSAFRFSAVVGLSALITIDVNSAGYGSTNGYVGVGVDSTSVNSAQIRTGGGGGSYIVSMFARLKYYHFGYHYYQALEAAQTESTYTFTGNAGITLLQSGMSAELKN